MQTTLPAARPRRPLRTTAPGRSRRRRLFLHELTGLLALAGPIIVSQLGTVGMTTVDTLMVGPLGATPLAAAAVGSAIHTTALWVCSGVILGMAPLVSQAFGAGRPDECRRVLVHGAWLALILSLPLIALCLLGQDVALLLRQKPDVARLAGGYLRALAAGVPPALLFMALRQYLEGMGMARPTMVMTLLGLGVNVLGNWAFIYGVDGWIPAMGVVGSGWATTLVRWTMLLAMAAYLLGRPALRGFAGVHWRPVPALLARITRIGAPIAGQLGVEVGLFAFAAIMMGWFGATQLAAHQVTINIAATTFMVALGASLAGSIRVGQHIGAGSRRAVRRAVFATYLLSMSFMGVCALLFVTLPQELIGLYTSDPGVVALGSTLLLFAALFQLFDGAQVAGICVLRGAADTRGPMLIAAGGYWAIGLPTAYLLGFRTPLGPSGIWAGLSVALGAVAVLLAARVRGVLWQGAAGFRVPRPSPEAAF
ncbi:MAG: MATE family efflux transporter [Gemmatimonadetes bacterium]|nr:MATE family efflux transporter [Gemmatimonadota bacterium]